MNHQPNTTSGLSSGADGLSDLSDRAANKADQALQSTRRMGNDAAHAVQAGIDGLREAVPSAISRATAQAEDLTRRGLERARQASATVREQATRVSDQTVGYIKDEPVKAVLVAAAAGAIAAIVIGWMSRSRNSRM